jgi:hypothetical protein
MVLPKYASTYESKSITGAIDSTSNTRLFSCTDCTGLNLGLDTLGNIWDEAKSALIDRILEETEGDLVRYEKANQLADKFINRISCRWSSLLPYSKHPVLGMTIWPDLRIEAVLRFRNKNGRLTVFQNTNGELSHFISGVTTEEERLVYGLLWSAISSATLEENMGRSPKQSRVFTTLLRPKRDVNSPTAGLLVSRRYRELLYSV